MYVILDRVSYVPVWVDIYLHTCVYMWKPEVGIVCLPLSTLIFEMGVSSLNLELSIWLVLPAGQRILGIYLLLPSNSLTVSELVQFPNVQSLISRPQLHGR